MSDDVARSASQRQQTEFYHTDYQQMQTLIRLLTPIHSPPHLTKAHTHLRVPLLIHQSDVSTQSLCRYMAWRSTSDSRHFGNYPESCDTKFAAFTIPGRRPSPLAFRRSQSFMSLPNAVLMDLIVVRCFSVCLDRQTCVRL